MKKYNYIVAAVLLVVGIGMIVGTMDFPYHGLSDIGGGFWPKLLGGALLLCSIGLALETALKKQPDEGHDRFPLRRHEAGIDCAGDHGRIFRSDLYFGFLRGYVFYGHLLCDSAGRA
ncbi:tripartite tricarboxylate transporter TctB family protein [Intestinibacillus sp. NTUH-41-i26]|uniref:tripartite tricarboxylate transporter TctB family protein n=1 Tax=Intestinibacillus sp. NTUH-41-i26 TaxID=3079303 RepID=UPI002934890C|nr:tripartite tricarboxylate transporter TctB family protein [Intestinibacillus sp. NTUH-41-i26]WOC76955.1 tripartite tricarboxylate transporter TctB family protein [Intestinibacillus sp. NTUH-41-i26]